ncbi:MAG TPA: helix-turn-helix domain-containing protein [Thermoanaerobaculia bacterium]|nr:helix-turn-helix domain-containing protein [Thermoanaerobaculia bacterium]
MAENEPQRQTARATFGEDLRRQREIRGISLREIAEATKVSQRLLEALEKDDYRHLPAPVFARGFVREYARYLGLDADEMVSRYVHHMSSIDDPEFRELPEPLHSERNTGEIPRPYARVDRKVWILIVLLAVLIGVILGVRFWLGRQPAAPPTTTAVTAAISSASGGMSSSPFLATRYDSPRASARA